MDIKKYNQFILEAEENDNEENGEKYVFNANPDFYVKKRIKTLKDKIEKMFGDDKEPTPVVSDVESPDFKKKVKKDKGITFEDLGLKLENSEIIQYTKNHYILEVKYSDNEYLYTIQFRVNVDQIATRMQNKDEELTPDDIVKCMVKFKKYTIENFDLIGEIVRNVNIDDVNEDYLVNLNIEFDEEYNIGDESDIGIEYEE